MRKLFYLLFLMPQLLVAQDAVKYQEPPQVIKALLLAKPTPSVSIDGKAEWMLLSERNSYPTVEELGQPEARIAGIRINPNNFSPSRQTFINHFKLKKISSNQEFEVKGLPNKLLASSVSWSPSEKKIAFLNTTANRVDLYVIDVATQSAKKINQQPLNVVLGNSYVWIDDQTILYKTTIAAPSAAPAKPITPQGPAVQENYGKAAPSRTYQDLIKTPYDEKLFEFLATAQLVKNVNGVEKKINKPQIFSSINISPDKKYLLIRTIQKPFSYLVTVGGFPSVVWIADMNGNMVKELAKLPSTETSPSGYDNIQDVMSRFDWRDDAPATITWTKPLDGGLIKTNTPYHDAVYALEAPFTGPAKELFKTEMRFRNILWGNDQIALVAEGLTGKQVARLSIYNPSTGTIQKLIERNTTDAYNNPGNPVTTKNKYGRDVLLLTDRQTKLLMNNTSGSSPKGDLPFLAKMSLSDGSLDIIWRCSEGSYEFVSEILDANQLVVLTRKESKTQTPNYFIKNIVQKIADRQITNFVNPYPQLDGITKQKIRYKRADGIDLTGDLYLPKGYNPAKDGKLPILMWAYPREFNSAADAAQVRGSEHRFTTLNWGSPIYWVTQGYAVLDNAEMPIVAVDGKKPNDTFIEQLKLNASAAIDHLEQMGVGDKNRVAVGGHSYGAFMTANLLAHTNLFKAGIARSGAYNRTLTPFGFQNEERTYWEAPQLYFEMSPFSYADKIKTPLLLIHGEADNNPGTFPINSERLFNAIKGHGGTVRYVSLPYESHGYSGQENLLHLLWEQHNWLERFVKNAR